MAQNTFSKPLNLSVIYDRVIPGDNWLVIGLLVLFVVCYAFDEVLGRALGLNQYTVASLAGLTTVCAALLVGLRDLFIRRWKLFYLRENEIIIAERNGQPVVISDTEQIRTGGLRGCSGLMLVDTRPWTNRIVECLAASIHTFIAVTLVIDPADPQKIRRWLDIEETDVTNELRACVRQVTHRLGRGVVLESPERLTVALEYEMNSRFFSSLGARCGLSVVHVADQSELDVAKQ